MNALVFEPHDDDLIIGMGGTALKMIRNGWEFHILQMTDGRHGSNKIEPEKLVEIRREEKREEISHLGIECDFLDYEDGKLWNRMQEDREKIVSEIQKILSQFEPDVVFMPAKSECHPDHRATSLLAGRAIYNSDINPLKVSYVVWQTPFTDGESLASKVIMTEIGEVFDQKLEVLRLHNSQINEGRYDEMVKSFNSYLGLLYSSYGDEIDKCEVLGVQNPEKLGKLENLEFKHVSNMCHGRSTEDIHLS
jgi:LmbE family N-acetylglucosaminyl deacetylase